MKINLIENQIKIIQDSLVEYSEKHPEKKQLIWSTYQSIKSQNEVNQGVVECNKNVIINFKKVVDIAKP